jgi:glycosyltransferase involved in cell wall biosynthesis
MRAFEPSVRVLGPLPHDDLRILFSTSDLMAVPSVWYENSPTVIYESLQVGTPVVGSNIGGIPELVEDEETGYLFPRGDAAMFAEKVINHFSRPARMRRHMRMHCVDVSRTRLSMDQHIAGIMRVYDDALAC